MMFCYLFFELWTINAFIIGINIIIWTQLDTSHITRFTSCRGTILFLVRREDGVCCYINFISIMLTKHARVLTFSHDFCNRTRRLLNSNQVSYHWIKEGHPCCSEAINAYLQFNFWPILTFIWLKWFLQLAVINAFGSTSETDLIV